MGDVLKSLSIFLSVVTLLILNFKANATVTNFEDKHLISVGPGISHPSAMTAHGSNPAGIIFNHSLKLTTFLSSDNLKFQSPKLGSTLLLGNHSSGLALGISQIKPHLSNKDTWSTPQSNNLFASVGAATYFNSVKTAIGFNFIHTLNGERSPFSSQPFPNNKPTSTSEYGLDIGMLFTPMSSVRSAISIFQVLDGLDHLAAGLALDFTDSFTLTLDNSYALKSQDWNFMPGLRIADSSFQFSTAYGIPINDKGVSFFSKSIFLGTLGISFSRNLHLALSYNTLGRYSAHFTVRSF